MRTTYTIEVKIELDQPTDAKMPSAVAERIASTLQQEWMADGESLLGYDGPLIIAKEVNIVQN